MANQGKRMVPEYLVKGLEEAYAKTSGGTGSTINLMENIVDSKGRKRFIEGILTVHEQTGMQIDTSEWSLSGTHLMILLSGKFEDASTITGKLATVVLPQWILDKISPLANILVDYKPIVIFNGDLSSNQTMIFNLSKDSTGLYIRCNSITMSAKRYFRIQFDCLINAK